MIRQKLSAKTSTGEIVIKGSIPALEGAAKTGLPLHIEANSAALG